MWSSKKDKGITLPPGKSLEIGFTAEWISNKEEVIIKTGDGEIVLDGKNELFLEVTASNADPVKIQIIPDFKNRKINVVEVIDINSKTTTDENKCRISFAGINTSKDDDLSIGEFLKDWDKNIEIFDERIRKYRKRRNIFMIFGLLVIAGNAYLFTINNGPMKYLNAIAITVMIYTSFRLENAYREMYKVYEKYKDSRSKAFEVAKDT